MGQHGSARLSVHSRLTIALRVQEQGWTVTAAARAANVSRQTASKWVGRYREFGELGLRDRSTRPHTIHRRLGTAMVRRIERLRRQRLGSHRIAWMLHLARSTVYRVLRRLGLERLSRLEPRPDPNRYEWPCPGDLLHLDTKKIGRMGRSAGWRFDRSQKGRHTRLGWSVVHVAIDDHSRLAYVEELADERPETAVAFLRRALEFYAAYGITVRRVMTDNGNPYRSRAFPAELASRGIRHIRTRPYTPRTNGKAEAMVKILLNGWAYARAYRSDVQRSAALMPFVDFYNRERPHGGLNGARPIDRVRQ
ncbi:MAG: IS481 family transposase [Gaiellaceae bacterium]